MPRNAEGMLDDISAADTPAAAVGDGRTDSWTEQVENQGTKAADDIGVGGGGTAQPEPETREKPAKVDPANSPARPDGYVPKQAIERVQGELQAERQARERAEANFQKFLDRWHRENAQPEMAETKEAPADPGEEPDAADNPYEWITWRQKKDRFEAHQRSEVTARQTATQRAIGEKQAEYAAVREQFPAIEEARQTVLKGWHREFWLQGYRGPALEQRVAQTEAQWAIYAHQQNMPIGEVIAGLAMARGWQPPADGEQSAKKDEPAEKDTPQRDPTTGKFVASEAEKAARIKESQERNGSLTQAPGTPVEKMTAKELAKMSEEDMWRHFDSMKGRKGSKDFDKSMGFR